MFVSLKVYFISIYDVVDTFTGAHVSNIMILFYILFIPFYYLSGFALEYNVVATTNKTDVTKKIVFPAGLYFRFRQVKLELIRLKTFLITKSNTKVSNLYKYSINS